MKNRFGILVLCLLVLLAGSCRMRGLLTAPGTSEPSGSSLATATPANENPNMPSFALFLDAGRGDAPPPQAAVARSRWAKINSDLLLDSQGTPLKLPPNAEITLNLFPDTIYIGIIEQTQEDGDSYTWVGHLKDVDTSALFILHTAGVFIAHFASPAGVYEVSNAGDDLYQITQVDQGQMPGGGDDTKIPTINP